MPSKIVINGGCEPIHDEIEDSIDNPIIDHFEAIDFHVLHQPLLFLKDQLIKEHGQAEGQKHRVENISKSVDDLLDFLLELSLEGHELLS